MWWTVEAGLESKRKEGLLILSSFSFSSLILFHFFKLKKKSYSEVINTGMFLDLLLVKEHLM